METRISVAAVVPWQGMESICVLDVTAIVLQQILCLMEGGFASLVILIKFLTMPVMRLTAHAVLRKLAVLVK